MNDPVDTDYANIKRMHGELFETAEARRLAKLTRVGDAPHSSVFRLGSLSTRTSQVVQAYWWVPAGFAVLVLLRAIIGA